MKILEVNINCGRGSTGRIVESIAEGLLHSGHECKVAYSSLPLPARCQKYSFRIGNNFDIYFHGLISRAFDAHGRGSYFSTKGLIREIESYNPDIIHLHNIHGYYLNYTVLFQYLKRCNSRIVWTLHDAWPMTGHCAYFDYAKCEKWKSGCHNCTQIRDYPRSLFIDKTKTNYQLKKKAFYGLTNLTLVTPSNWLANVVKESYLNNYNIETIYNGIDLSIFHPDGKRSVLDRFNIPKEKKILLGIASVWDRRKGLADFIELNRLISPDFQIVLVGLKPQQIQMLPKNIIGIKRTENLEELTALYSLADIFLNLTHEDNFPTTNLEALACGTPVLTYETGGSPEAIDDTCGRTVETGNINGVLDQIAQLSSSKCLVNDCITRACYFSSGKMVEQYLQLFDKVLQS